jgi:hypothetical protein
VYRTNTALKEVGMTSYCQNHCAYTSELSKQAIADDITGDWLHQKRLEIQARIEAKQGQIPSKTQTPELPKSELTTEQRELLALAARYEKTHMKSETNDTPPWMFFSLI